MQTITRRNLLQLGTAATALLASPSLIRPAFASTTTITIASLLGEDRPETKVWRFFAKRTQEELPEHFRFNIVTNGALGGEKQIAESIRLGSIQASLSTTSALSGWVPELQILDLPFLFRGRTHLKKVISGPIGNNLKEQLANEQFIVGGFIDYGARQLLAKKPITLPEQLEGKTIRVINSPLHTQLWSIFGAIPVGVPITETYNALASGLADAMDMTKSAYAGFKLYEVVPFMTETNHIRSSGVIYFSAPFWNTLSPETQSILHAISGEAAAYFNALIIEDEAVSMEIAQANGGKILQPENIAAWRDGALTVWLEMAPIVGGVEKIELIENT